MPMVPVPEDAGFRTVTGRAPQPEPFQDPTGPAFRQGNSVVSVVNSLYNMGAFGPEQGYSALDDIKGTPYFDQHADLFAGSSSRAETAAIKRRIDGEEADRRALASSGLAGVMASMVAGALDPTMAMPSGMALKVGKEGWALGKAALSTGAAFGAQAATQEAALQATQFTRPMSETALNVGTATLLGAIIGPGAARLLGKPESDLLRRALEADRRAMNEHAAAPGNVVEFPKPGEPAAPATPPAPASPLSGDMTPPSMAASAGAAATDTRKLEQVPTGPGVRAVADRLGPVQRNLASQSTTARRATVDLAETPRLFKENLEGIPTTQGPALEREAMMAIRSTRVSVFDRMTKLFSDYRFAKDDISFPQTRAAWGDLTGNADGKLSFSQFKAEVSKAMQEGDRHDIPQVAAAAQHIRKTVFDPWKERAIAAGLLPEDVGVKTAESYFQRLYNKQVIAAKRPEFVNRITDWLESDQATKAQAKDRITFYAAQLRSWEDQIGKLDARFGRAEERAKRLDARAAERSRDDMPKTAGMNAEAPTGRTADLQIRKATIAAEAKDLADLIDLMEGMGNQAPNLAQTLSRTRAMLERRKITERVEGARYSEAGRQAKSSEKRLAELERQLDSVEGRKDLIEEMSALAEEFRNEVRAKIEAEIAAWEGKSVSEAKSALKAREKYSQDAAAAGTRGPDSPRLASADQAVDRAVKRIIEDDRDLSREDLRGRAHEITDRILGSPDGRLPYDIHMGGPEVGWTGGGGEPPRGALAARDFMIPDATIRDFLEQDVEHVIDAHLRTMVPDTLLTEKFGDVRMTETFRKINDEYAALTDAAKTEKERRALEKERQRVVTDVAAIRDRLRGVYGFSTDAPVRNAARIVRAVKNYNVLTSMGVAALSSLPDLAGSAMRHGFTVAFNDAWAPFFSYLVGQSDAWKEGGRQIRAMGIATESLLASRHHQINDIMDSFRPQSRVERALQWGADRFQLVNLLGPWTDFAKINASLIAGSEILRATEAVTKGTVSARRLRTLAENGIDAHMATRIHEAFQAGGEVRDGVHLPNTGDWTDAAARRAFEGAVGREADIAVVTPGQEKALWLSNPVLGVFGQFKSFTAGATERIMVANLQRRDAQVLSGIMFSMGLGMLSYRLNALTGGQPVSDKPGDWIKEGLSRGNVFGWLEEGNALAGKASGGAVDVYRMLGSGKPLTRYQSRSALDQLLGPTAGKAESLLKVTSAAGRRDWNESDTKALRRLTAGQNLFYLRQLFDKVEAGTNNAFHIEMKPKPIPKH